MKLKDILSEKNKGLWANIAAKKKRGEKSDPRSKSYKAAKKAGQKLNRGEGIEETINEEYIESMDHMQIDKHLAAIEMQWLDWKRGPMTEPSDIKPARKELLNYITKFLKKAIK
tara:strand:+ start:52 stop:393 length:342 start_codon:yes stop_codon:yes gene_type:complete